MQAFNLCERVLEIGRKYFTKEMELEEYETLNLRELRASLEDGWGWNVVNFFYWSYGTMVFQALGRKFESGSFGDLIWSFVIILKIN